MHEPHIHPQVGQGSPNVGVNAGTPLVLGTFFGPPLLVGVMYLFGHSGKGELPG